MCWNTAVNKIYKNISALLESLWFLHIAMETSRKVPSVIQEMMVWGTVLAIKGVRTVWMLDVFESSTD